MASFIPFSNQADRYDEQKFLALVSTLRETHKIYIRTVNFKDREADEQNTNVLRVSTHLFNSFEDIDRLLGALEGIVG
jgi:selenocysteine lyase/cysteine desulfurase